MKTHVKTALNFFSRPRYLRAIPSLVVLTTAMAWGVAPDMTDGDGDGAQKKARVTLSNPAETPAVVAQGLLGSKPARDA
ncbi:MAG: hypothetical protein V4454_00625 [Pseudomonadota bacterium]